MIEKLRREIRETAERTYDELVGRYEELHGVSDRAAAILAAAYFEGKLEEAIKRKFASHSKEVEELFYAGENIFGHGKGAVDPIRNFSSKIEIGFALRLYSDKIIRKLHKVREIRNEFAHSSKPITFDHEEIDKKCREIISASDCLRIRYIEFLKEIEQNIADRVSVPGQIKSFTATAGNGEVDLSWTLPSGILTEVQVRWKKTDGMPFNSKSGWNREDLSGTATSHKATELENGIEYVFAICAENLTGPGEEVTTTARPRTTPSP